MYKVYKNKPTSLIVNNSVEGETIEQKVARALHNGEGIEDSVQVIYTERKNGVMPEYNPRADKWEIAVEAMDKISKDNLTKRKNNIVKFNPDIEKGGEKGGENNV